MPASYDLRSGGGQLDDGPAYASLPGTGQSGFVTANTTKMKEKLNPKREVHGCHPSRWIWELTNNAFSTCDVFQRARAVNFGSEYAWDHQHSLVINGNQSYSLSSSRLLSSVCLECGFHFVFKMEWDELHARELCLPSQARWPLPEDAFPWHHLVWAGSDADSNIQEESSKYYPLLARENFVCSAPPCTFQLTLEISAPRMGAFIHILQDHDVIRKQLIALKEQEPSRYEAATDDWVYQAPLNLNTYLKNLLESTTESIRSISKRNKRFAVLFGPPAFRLFRELEFREEVQQDEDSVDDGKFTPVAPSPPSGPSGATELGSYRAFIEDARSEVQCLIHQNRQTSEGPTFCSPILHADLRCKEVMKINGSTLLKVERYEALGVLPSQSRDVIVNAYHRQWELLPTRRHVLIESLMAIANDLNDGLLSEYAVMQSSMFESQVQAQKGSSAEDALVPRALEFLGLQTSVNYSAQSVIQAFRTKVARHPEVATDARSMLMQLAQSSTDDTYQTALLMEADTKMSSETAQLILEISDLASSWREISKIIDTKIKGSMSLEELRTYLDAGESLAHHLASEPLEAWCIEQRHLFETSSGSSVRSTLDTLAIDFGLPVGLHNIGNTCYLNSLLQYLFTIKPVRDIVLDYDRYKLPLNDEAIDNRRLGGNKMQLDRGEAVVSQAFASELGTLFEALTNSDQLSTRPSQRLANAVLLSTHILLNGQKTSLSRATTPQPPPLPARPSPAPPNVEAMELDGDAPTKHDRPIEDLSLRRISGSSDGTLVNVGDADDKIMGEQSIIEGLTIDSGTGLVEQNSGKVDSGPIPLHQDPSAKPVDMSRISSTTGHDGDAVMLDVPEPEETIDHKVLAALQHQERTSGTDQQDVEEVMGSIINRLQAAIQPTSIDVESGIQVETIMETFFVTTVNYTKKFTDNKYQSEISFDRAITAFPAPNGACSLYEALGRNFDQQIIEESELSRYTAIKTLPPILHVLLQRTQSTGGKNSNAVVIPEVLHLDRFMDAPHDSPTFRRQVTRWAIADRKTDIQSQMGLVPTTRVDIELVNSDARGPQDNSTPEEADSPTQAALIDITEEENWDFDGPVEDDFILVQSTEPSMVPSEAAPRPSPEGLANANDTVLKMMKEELEELETSLESLNDSATEIRYRLHAVICHRGHLRAGHYWVWIHDFEEDVWRSYNDATVTVNKNTNEVLSQLSSSGEPYFLCYVRDEDKSQFVNVPKRNVPALEAETVGDTIIVQTSSPLSDISEISEES